MIRGVENVPFPITANSIFAKTGKENNKIKNIFFMKSPKN
jgi:hypothetical protein